MSNESHVSMKRLSLRDLYIEAYVSGMRAYAELIATMNKECEANIETLKDDLSSSDTFKTLFGAL